MALKHWLRLQQLSASLAQSEKDYFKKVLRASIPKNNGQSKLLDLFDLLQNSQTIPSIDQKDQKRKLLGLLEDRILDNLLMDINLMRKQEGSVKNRLLLNHKNFLKSRVLMDRGIMKKSFHLAGNCAQKAIEMEDFALALQAMRFQLSTISLHRFEKDFHYLLQQIDHYDYCHKLKNTAIRIYKELQLKKHLGLNENLDLFVEQGLEKLSAIQEKLGSHTVRYVRLYFQKEWYEMQGIPRQALHIVSHLYNLCKQLMDCHLILSAHELTFEQGRLSFEMGDIPAARFFLGKAQKELPMECESRQKAHELLFLIDFTEGRFLECEHQISQLSATPYFKDLMPPLSKTRWMFYQCCLYMFLEREKECLSKIRDTFEQTKPSPDINLHLRFMRIMCLIDLEELDDADHELEALRKFLTRNKLQPVLEDIGLTAFYEMLVKVRYCGYRFELLSPKGIHLMELKMALKAYLGPKPLSYRMVPYSTWLAKKAHPQKTLPFIYENLHEHRREIHSKNGKVHRLFA